MSSTRESITASAVALERIRLALNLSGTVLAWGVGGAVFSVAILRTSVLPDWLGWLGLLFALIVWLIAFQVVYRPLEKLFLPFLAVGFVWLTAMGLSLLLIDPASVSGGSGLIIDDAGFVKLGGALELVAVLLVVVSLGLSITSDHPEPNPKPSEMGEWLSETAAANGAYRATSWSLVVDHLLEIAFVVALYRLFVDAGTVALLAVLAGVLGLLLVAISGIVQVGLAELALTHE